MASSRLGPLWDAHVHLPAYPDPWAVVEAAGKRGMRLVSVTVSLGEAAPSLLLREQNPSTVKCFIGVHPSEAASTPEGLPALDTVWEAADGVGEVGLDPKYSEVSAGSAQMKLFEAQVEVAGRLRKPLQVHSRDAEGACLDVIEGYSPRSILMHWFEGEESLGRALSRPRLFVSFGPAILYSKKLLRMARRCPPGGRTRGERGARRIRGVGRGGGAGARPQRGLQAGRGVGQEPGTRRAQAAPP